MSFAPVLDKQSERGDALADRAEGYLEKEQLQLAIDLFDQAEPWVVDPDRCAGGRWMAHMLAGNFEAAWRESDAIRGRGAPDPHRFWNGEPLEGKRLILRSLHGFGDAVQMFRFLPRLRRLVSDLVVEVPPRLVELAPCFAGMGRVITWGEQAPAVPPAWDVQMEVMELPFVLRVTESDLVAGGTYLRLPAGERDRVRLAMGPRKMPRVGFVWGAGAWNPSRSIPYARFRSLLETPGIESWNLQGEPERQAWLQTQDAHQDGSRDVYRCGDGILTLAAVIEQMDLVITVDTLAAHLAGALGVPCWLLLQHRADWRWMSQRDRSPWYPSLRLFRQSRAGDWGTLVEEVRVQLEAVTTGCKVRQ